MKRAEHLLAVWIAAVALHVVLPGLAAGQDPVADASFAERVEVKLVDVDVWVLDRQGDAVTGLGPEDFELLHDGGPVEISHFVEVRAGKVHRRDPGAGTAEVAAGGVSGAQTVGEDVPGHVVVFFDQSRLHPTNYPPLVRALEEFLAAGEIADERVLIVRQNDGLFVEAPFGSSRGDLEAALERLSQGTASGAALDAETEQALEAIRQSWEENQDVASSAASGIASIPQSTPGGPVSGAPSGGPRATVGGVGTGGGSDACGSFLGQIEPVLSSWARSRGARADVTLSSLSDIASFLAGLPGVKTLLYLSDGLDTNPGEALADYAAGFCPTGGAQLRSRARADDMTGRFLELTRHANSNRVTVHALQATGLRSSRTGSAAAGRRSRGGAGRSGGSFEQSERSSNRRGLELLAGETGGRAVFNQNELGSDLERIARESRTYYSLAYEPPPGDDGREHRIEVRLRDRSLTARYRRGYLEKDSSRRLSERIEGALNLGITDNPLAVRLGAGAAVAGQNGSFILPLHVMVPVERLALSPQEGGSVGEVLVRVMARNLASSSLSVRDKSFRLKVPDGASGFADLTVELELAGGTYLTAIGVEDATSGEASFVSTTLQVESGG